MDRVRFGRVLGKGARLAARTALEAVDAATSPAPPVPGAADHSRPEIMKPAVRSASPPPMRPTPQLGPAARAAGLGAVAPLRQASRALWHEVTGSFFALFALSFGVGAWHTRAGAWSTDPSERHRLAFFCALACLFAYFSLSSFARARKRSSA